MILLAKSLNPFPKLGIGHCVSFKLTSITTYDGALLIVHGASFEMAPKLWRGALAPWALGENDELSLL